ncbi:RHS repeat domain-containing protein [Aquimarina pacifica]|uniref:RHS repeat domain-containing protein n=1 Tax=Aquimarina pacifica TaxID=1296415 RepID=UPI00046E8E74|nr:RHS repeat-associated core domain-containing protein [Aquimarina pacifica]
MRKYFKIIFVLGTILFISNFLTAQTCIELDTNQAFSFGNNGGEIEIKMDSYTSNGPSSDCYLANTDDAYVEIDYVGTQEGWITSASISYYENDELGDTEYYLKVICAPVTTPSSRSARLFIYDGNGNRVTYSDNGIPVYQNKGDLEYWYPDEDGDGLGYSSTLPIMATSPPYTGWVTDGNWSENGNIQDDQGDFCPYTYGTLDGCPVEIPQYSYNQNLVGTKSYDRLGNIKSHGVNYFDALAKPNKTISWDFKTNTIWMSETFYDYQGRAALQTLSAPTNLGEIEGDYKLSRISITDYEKDDIEDPSVVENDREGTLGWYYSENNTRNDYQDVTPRPYSRTIYSELNPGTVNKTIGGNKIDGAWKNGYTFSMPAGQELARSVAFGDPAYNPENYKIIKTVSRDVHGVESVVFTDTDGKVIASARSGNETGNVVNGRTSYVKIGEQAYVDIHIPVGRSGISVNNSTNMGYKVYNLITEEQETMATGALPNGFYRIAMSKPDIYPKDGMTVTYPENYYDYSLNEYDEAGRIISSKQPLQQLESTFEYNALGQLTQTHSPDEGDAWFLYRKDGQIRFSINSKQWENKEFSYTNYDQKGRPIESGVYSDVNLDYLAVYSNTVTSATEAFKTSLKNLVDTQDGDGLTDVNCSEVHKTQYDVSSYTNLLPDDYEFPTFLSGNIAKTENENTTTWYSYDIYGRVKWIVQRIEGLSGYKTIDYEYHPITNQVNKVWYQKGDNSDTFIHRYTYDPVDYSLVKVETSTDNSTYTEHASYEYYETGALKRLNLAEGLQGIDYVYNLNGALKGINHPNLAGSDPGNDNKDLFGMTINYYNGDYKRTNTPTYVPSLPEGIDQYNGNIKSIIWSTNGHSDKDRYYYKYNKNNWLEGASFNEEIEINSSLEPEELRNQPVLTSEIAEATKKVKLTDGFSITATNTLTFKAKISNGAGVNSNGDYNVYDITYDANGNIQTLNRNKDGGSAANKMDQLSYQYKTDKPNQLLRVDDATGNVAGADDIGDQNGQNYEYNTIGQLIKNNEENISYIYNTSGLVAEIQKDDIPLVKFFYNDKNHRVRKESYNPENGNLTYTEHYVRDASGTAMAIYRDGAVIENTIYGTNRLGVHKSDGTSLYQLTDHLGNVRAVVGKTTDGTEFEIKSATDYYPGGMVMPNRNMVGDYRYGYQGEFAETDPETGKVAFELRLYDPRINRWMTTDPAKQYASPYMSMGNNWANQVDPDGAFSPPTDYYDKDSGAYLGNIDDGIDQVAFVDSGVFGTLSSLWTGGHKSAYWGHLSDYSQIIKMSHANFKDIAGTLFAEGSTQMSVAEATGIYSVMENRAAADGKTVLDIASGGGIYGWGHRDKINSIYANKAQVNNSYLGVRNGYFNADTSGGAYFWHGTDFGKKNWQAYKSYYLVGFKFTDTAHDLWNLGNHKSKHSWLYKYESTGASGGTTFMRLTTAWQSANGSTRWNGQ